jgi:hypothetical protein
MRAARRHVCLLFSLAVLGATPTTDADATAQSVAPGQPSAARSADPVRKRTPGPAIDHATTLLQMQAILGRMAVSSELVPDDARELTRLMSVARGRTIAEAAMSTLSIRLALAIAEGSFDDESLERLAQDLFAAVNSRELTVHEASLLVTDVAMLLRDSGAEPGSIDVATAALAAIGPAGVDKLEPPAPLSSRPGGLQVLTRKQ